MSQLERQQNILNILKKRQSVSIKDLSKLIFASESSVRRDIASLEKRGLVTQIYGGVMMSRFKNSVTPVDIRDPDNSDIKEMLAKQAASLVKNGDTVMMDSSSTVRRIVKYLADFRDLKIITNNQRIISESDSLHTQLYCTGGAYNYKNHNFTGPAAESFLRTVKADILFFSSQGLSNDGEISDVSEEETSLRRIMLSRCTKCIFLCDSTKVGGSHIFTLCNISDISGVICDKPELIEAIRA